MIRRAAALAIAAVAVLIGALVLFDASGAGRHAATLRSSTRIDPRTAAADVAIASLPPIRPARASAATPQARAFAHVLRYTSYMRLGTARRREVALTFDDGPGPYTGRILHILRRMHVPATFFVIGEQVAAYRRLIAAEVRAGCEVGDHTWSHPPLGLLRAAAQKAQIRAAARAIQRAGAPTPVLLRPPYGSLDSTTLRILHRLRMLMVLWSADTSDYARPGVKRIEYVAISGAQPGAIILMHDGGGDRSQTVAALPHIIASLRRRRYKLVTVSRLIADDPPPRGQPPPVSLSGD